MALKCGFAEIDITPEPGIQKIGRLGYIPTKEAFARGGYETTFGPSSCLGEDAGDILAEAIVALIRERYGA